MRAAIDETIVDRGGQVRYVLAGVLAIADDADLRASLASVTAAPGRKRPFHWHLEGPKVRARMVRCLTEVGAIAHVVIDRPVAPGRQEAARARALSCLLPLLRSEGATELVIESRGNVQDKRDRMVILEWLKSDGCGENPTYGWHPKSDPYLWLADAVCGATRDFLTRSGEAHFNSLFEAKVIGEPVYVGPP